MSAKGARPNFSNCTSRITKCRNKRMLINLCSSRPVLLLNYKVTHRPTMICDIRRPYKTNYLNIIYAFVQRMHCNTFFFVSPNKSRPNERSKDGCFPNMNVSNLQR